MLIFLSLWSLENRSCDTHGCNLSLLFLKHYKKTTDSYVRWHQTSKYMYCSTNAVHFFCCFNVWLNKLQFSYFRNYPLLKWWTNIFKLVWLQEPEAHVYNVSETESLGYIDTLTSKGENVNMLVWVWLEFR